MTMLRFVADVWKRRSITLPIVVAVLGVLPGACASFDPEWRCNTGALDCSQEAVKNRVLGAFDVIHPVEVLECVGIPSLTCYSWDPDEEACLVRLAPTDATSFIEEEGGLAEVPSLVRRLNNYDPRPLSRGSIMKTELREQAIYTSADDSVFIMFLADRRCSNLEEHIF